MFVFGLAVKSFKSTKTLQKKSNELTPSWFFVWTTMRMLIRH